MSPHLFDGFSVAVEITFIISLAIVAVIKRIITYRMVCYRESQRTRRLEKALDGVTEPYRESVIRACGELENGGEGQRD